MSQYLDSLPVRLQLIFLLLVLLVFCAVIHTNDGIIEGDDLDDARVIGVVTFMVKEIPRGDGDEIQN